MTAPIDRPILGHCAVDVIAGLVAELDVTRPSSIPLLIDPLRLLATQRPHVVISHLMIDRIFAACRRTV
jgi:hypothetical protein